MCLQAVGLVVQEHGLDLATPRLKVWPLMAGERFVGRAWGLRATCSTTQLTLGSVLRRRIAEAADGAWNQRAF